MKLSEDRLELFRYGYGLNGEEIGEIIVDSDLSREYVLRDEVVPAVGRDIHTKMKPYLRVVSVVYLGFDGQIHLGQIVVHMSLVADTHKAFQGMLKLRFPFSSVIPASEFGYDDEASMAANNSSNYRPDPKGEHRKGSAFDINPRVNPFDTLTNGVREVKPQGATYDPTARGALTETGDVRRLWTRLGYEWGGGWGNPSTVPASDFFREGFFDYHHFQLNEDRYGGLFVPSGV